MKYFVLLFAVVIAAANALPTKETEQTQTIVEPIESVQLVRIDDSDSIQPNNLQDTELVEINEDNYAPTEVKREKRFLIAKKLLLAKAGIIGLG